jgi:hypothetical protein
LDDKLVEEIRNCQFLFRRPIIAGRDRPFFRLMDERPPSLSLPSNEARLLAFGDAFEQATERRRDPRFIASSSVPQTRTWGPDAFASRT